MATATITTTTATVFIPQIWATGTNDAVEFAARIQKRVTRKFEKELTVGNTLNISEIPNLSTQTKSSGYANTVVFEALTPLNGTITVATHEYAAFLIEDVVKIQSIVDLRQKWEKKIGYALARGRDASLAALPASLATIVGTLGVEYTADDYLTVYQNFATAGLIEDGPNDEFSIFLSPAAYVAALKVDVFTNRQYNTAGDAIQRARIGDIYGFPVYVSNLVAASGAGHNNFAMHRDCFALVVQEEVPVRSDYMIEHLGDAVVGWNLYGVAELNYPIETPGQVTETDNRGQLLRSV